MIVSMSKKELQHVRKVLGGLNNPEATKVFNEIFSKSGYNGIVGFVNPVSEKVEIKVPEKSVNIVGEVLEKYSPVFGRAIKKGIGIGSISSLFDTVKCLWKELEYRFNQKR